jgi:hypothetical protein
MSRTPRRFAWQLILFCCAVLFPFVGHSQMQRLYRYFPFSRRSAYFDFRYRRDAAKIKEISDFSDGVVNLVDRDFFKASYDYPIRVLVLENLPQYQVFVARYFGLIEGRTAAANAWAPHKLFVTYVDAGVGTFAAEIAGTLAESNLNDRPGWAVGGVPAFFDNFYGYWTNGQLIAYWGYQNPARLRQIGTNLLNIDLKEILATPTPSTNDNWVDTNEAKERMVSVFLWEQGRFKRFLKLIATRDKAGYPSYFEAAMEMPVDQILPLWQGYLHDVASDYSDIMTMPPTTICPDQASFQDFVKTNEIPLDQPKQIDH